MPKTNRIERISLNAARVRFPTGTLVCLHDGAGALPLSRFPTADRTTMARLLVARGLADAADSLRTSVNAFLWESGGKHCLFDTGNGHHRGPAFGNVVAGLRDAGIEPDAVDTVLMTHLHIDHAGGLAGPDGLAIFPSATLLIGRAEAEFWFEKASLTEEKLVPSIVPARAAQRAYHERLKLFDSSTDLPAGIAPVALPGHTPGHIGFVLETGEKPVFIWGDVVHAEQLQFTRPDWSVSFDVDPETAELSRRKALELASDRTMLVGGMHLSFPGLGTVHRGGNGFQFDACA